jgi:hypothetical protein
VARVTPRRRRALICRDNALANPLTCGYGELLPGRWSYGENAWRRSVLPFCVYRRNEWVVVSFSACAKRVRDSERPMNQRVHNFSSCLSLFNLFGFTATARRLRFMVGARPDAGSSSWTTPQLLAAFDHLEAARRSFAAFADEQVRLGRALKRENRAAKRPSQRDQFIEWLENYIDDGHAAEWYVDDLGLCDQCSHRLIFHGSRRGCRACRNHPACTRSLPDPWV